MTSLVCPAVSHPKRHFSQRQRSDFESESASQITEIPPDERTTTSPTFPSFTKTENPLNSPTKSVKASNRQKIANECESKANNNNCSPKEVRIESGIGIGAKQTEKEVSESDKAILECLSQLVTDTKNLNRRHILFQKKEAALPSAYPLCNKCSEPVYPQEAVRPSLDLTFHASCFKCCHCGVKLTLGTFYSCSSGFGVTRIYCRAHLLSPEIRVLSPFKAKEESSAAPDVIKSDQIGLRYF